MQSPGTVAQLEREFRATVSQIGDVASDLQAGIVIEDTARRVLGCNRRFAELLGIGSPASELIGSDLGDVIRRAKNLDDADSFLKRLEEIIDDGKFVSSETLHLRESTLERDYLPIYLGRELTAYLWQYRDVSERVQAMREVQESEGRFAAIFDAAPVSLNVARMDDGRILAANRALTALVGFETDEVLGRTAIELGIVRDSAIREQVIGPVRRGETTRSFPFEAHTKFGETRQVEIAAAPLQWCGEPAYVLAALDLTEQKLAEAALTASERRFETMFKAAPLAMALSTLEDGRFLQVNPTFADLLGHTVDEIVGHTSTELGFFANPNTRADAVADLAAGATLHAAKVTARTRDGTERELDISVSLVDLAGERCLLTVADDITERNLAQAALAESEAINRSILEALPDLMFRMSADGTILDYRPGPGFETRAVAEPVIGRNVHDVLPPEGARRVLAVASQALSGESIETFEYEVTRDGDRQVRELRCIAYAPAEVVAIIRDITPRKRAEQQLRQSEERFRLLAENAQDIIFRYRIAEPGGMEYISPSVTKIAGYLPEDYYADPEFPRNVVHPGDREAFDKMVTERVTGPIELRWIRADGSVLWTEQTNVYVTDSAGQVIAVEGVIRDLTARREAEQALRLSEERFRLLAENAHDIIFRYRVAEPRGTEYMSPSVTRIAGYQPEEYYDDPDFSLSVVHPEDRHLLQEMASLREARTFKLRWFRKDGEVVWAEQTMVPIFDDNGRLVAVEGVGRDITATVQAEDALQRARDELEGKVEQAMVGGNKYGLTFREFTVLHHVVAGETDKVIAAALGISPLTVHKHVASILAKMHASSRTEAGVRALREGLVGRSDLDSQPAT
jgi:PAS domain S-box-containing protein